MDKNCITYFDADEPIESDEQKRVRRVCICASVDKQYDIVDPYRLLLFAPFRGAERKSRTSCAVSMQRMFGASM